MKNVWINMVPILAVISKCNNTPTESIKKHSL